MRREISGLCGWHGGKTPEQNRECISERDLACEKAKTSGGAG